MVDVKINVDDLEFTQARRRQLAEKIEEVNGFEDDPELVQVFLKTLDGMDKQTLALLKLKSDEEQGDKDRAAATAAIELSRQFSTKGVNPFMVQPKDASGAPIEKGELPDKEFSEGHKSQMKGAQPSEDWEQLSRRMEEEGVD